MWYGRAALRGCTDHLARGFLVVVAGVLLFGAIAANGPAQSPSELRDKAADLQRRSDAAVLDLYALGSRLEQSRAELARLDAQLAELRRQQASARRQYRAALVTATRAEQQLGAQLRRLYQEDEPDPIAVILGAASLEEAIQGLDDIKRIARATESVLEQAEKARGQVALERKQLAAQVQRTGAARGRAAAAENDLVRAQSERETYLAQLRTEQQLTEQQIQAADRQAAEAQQRAQLVSAQAQQESSAPSSSSSSSSPSPQSSPPDAAEVPEEQTTTFETPETAAPGEPPPSPVESVSQSSSGSTASAPGPPRSGGTMTVVATAYCLTGTTATGLPVGPGIVAVDPTVIPLGTRMRIPGYGDGVAADTGGGVKGARIDVWMASCSAASAFTRTLTITFL